MSDEVRSSNPQLEQFANDWMSTTQKSAKLAADFLQKQQAMTGLPIKVDETSIKALQDMAYRFASDPVSFSNAQMKLWNGLSEVWLNIASKYSGVPGIAQEKSGPKDRRFKDETWEEEATFDYIKETYLFVSDWTQSLANDAKGMSDKDRKRVQFLSRQFSSAISPSNFVMTNPEVLKKTVESGGANLLSGFKNLLGDLEKGKGKLKISMTDEDAFKIGENIACTPGKVVFKNHLFELIQYSPTTEKTYKTPVLFVPPWINKYYVFDLQPKTSYIKWVVDQGYTLFVISWINPSASEAEIAFGDYMKDGTLVALDFVLKETKEKKANMLGFCIGGILLTTTLAYLAAKGDNRVNSATLLATMVDMTDAGEMSLFFDEEQLADISEKVSSRGYLEGEEMAGMFNMMRENDLVWTFVVNNYLLGRDPVPFDLLYWNADATRMPAKMIMEYLTGFYRDNVFMSPGKLTIDGVAIDVNKIKTPVYMIATKDDHIAPWRSCFAGMKSFIGPRQFVLGASGHIAGIVNPPAKKKYCYWKNNSKKTITDSTEWFEGAVMHEGSWWEDWEKWLSQRSGELIPARKIKEVKSKPLIDAPGTYVRVRSD